MWVHVLLFSFASSRVRRERSVRPCGTLSQGSEHLPRRAAPTRAAGAALLSGVCSPLIYLALLSGLYDLGNILFHHFYLRSGLNLQFETMDISMLSSQQATLIPEPQCRLEQGRRSGRAHAAAPRRAGAGPSAERGKGRRPATPATHARCPGRGAPPDFSLFCWFLNCKT